MHAAGEHVVVDGAQAREHGGGAAHDGAQFAAQPAAHGDHDDATRKALKGYADKIADRAKKNDK